MDISVKLQEDHRLNVRAAAIIIHDNKILVHKDVNFSINEWNKI